MSQCIRGVGAELPIGSAPTPHYQTLRSRYKVRVCEALPDDSPWERGLEALPGRQVVPDGRNLTYPRMAPCLARDQPSGVICIVSHFHMIAQRPSPHCS